MGASAGYIKLYRGWRDTDGLLPSETFSDFEAWLWLLENAAWKETSRWNAKGEEIPLKRGQIHVSLASLSKAFGWQKKRVRLFLERVQRASKVVSNRAQSGTILTICNYDEYQGCEQPQGHSQGTARAQPGHTQEEGKEGKEENSSSGYAFCRSVIKLNKADFERWQDSFSPLDLPALLESRDAWLSTQADGVKKKWFTTTPSWLANKKAELLERRRAASEPEFSGPC